MPLLTLGKAHSSTQERLATNVSHKSVVDISDSAATLRVLSYGSMEGRDHFVEIDSKGLKTCHIVPAAASSQFSVSISTSHLLLECCHLFDFPCILLDVADGGAERF